MRTLAILAAGVAIILLVLQPAAAQTLSSADLMNSTLRRAMAQKAKADENAMLLERGIQRGDKGALLGEDVWRFYEATIDHCLTQQSALQARLADQKRSRANMSAWGKFIALLGAVTAYAPGKTVLMGIGISGSDDSSVLGYFAQNSSEEIAALEKKVATGMGIYAARIAEYRGISPADDTDGLKRKAALLGAKEACDGLYVDVAAANEDSKVTETKGASGTGGSPAPAPAPAASGGGN